MRISLALATALLTYAFVPARTEAQVSARIVIGGHPVSGVIRIGDPHVHVIRERPRGHRVVVVEHRAPRVIVVHKHHHKKHKWKKHDYRRIVVYYDRRHDRYYDAYRPGLVEWRAYERDGRFYRDDDWDRRYRDRWDDRRWDRDGRLRYDPYDRDGNDRYERDRYDRDDRDDRDDRYERDRRDDRDRRDRRP